MALQLVGTFFVFIKSCIYKISLLLNFYWRNDLKFTFEGFKKTFGKKFPTYSGETSWPLNWNSVTAETKINHKMSIWKWLKGEESSLQLQILDFSRTITCSAKTGHWWFWFWRMAMNLAVLLMSHIGFVSNYWKQSVFIQKGKKKCNSSCLLLKIVLIVTECVSKKSID